MTEEWSSDRRGETNDRFYFNPKKEERMPCKVFVEKNGQVHEETSEVEYKYTPTPSTVHVELKLSA